MATAKRNGRILFEVGYKKKIEYQKIIESHGYTLKEFMTQLLEQGIDALKTGNFGKPTKVEILPQKDNYLCTTAANSTSISYAIKSSKKKILDGLTQNKRIKTTELIPMLLICWLRDKQTNKQSDVATVIISPSTVEGKDARLHFQLNKKAKEEIQNILKPNGYKLAQLITSLLDAWIAANKHELPAEETL